MEKIRDMLVEIYTCASAWDNDDGKMAEANERTPEDILSGIIENARQELAQEIKVLATEPIWDKTKDIREAEIKTRTPKELCEAIDDLQTLLGDKK